MHPITLPTCMQNTYTETKADNKFICSRGARSMDSRFSANKINSRSRFQIPQEEASSPWKNNNFGRFEAGKGTENNIPHSSSLNALKWSPPPILSETVPPENFDALMFEAMDKHNNDSSNNIKSNKALRSRQVRTGRRSCSRVPANKDEHNNDHIYSIADSWKFQRPASFDQFLTNRLKSSNNDVSDQFLKWEPLRPNDNHIAVNDNVRDRDGDVEYLCGSMQSSDGDDVASGSNRRSATNRENIANPGPNSEHKAEDAKTRGFKTGAFVFGASQAKSGRVENPHKVKSERAYGEFYAGRPGLSAAFASRSPRSSDRPISSIFVSNVGSSFDSRVTEKEDHSLVQGSDSFGSGSVTSPGFGRASARDVDNEARTRGLQSEGGSRLPSSASMEQDSSVQIGESLHSADSLSSNLNHTFLFGAKKEVTKGHPDRRETETTNVPTSNNNPLGYGSRGLRGMPRAFSETKIENALHNYDNMPELEQSSTSSAQHFQFGYKNQRNFHQANRGTDVKEPKDVSVNLQTDVDQQINAENVCDGKSPIGDGGECSSFDHHVPVSSSAYDWLNCSFEKVREDTSKSGTNNAAAKVGGNTRRRHTSGEGSLASGFAKKGHRSAIDGNAKLRTSNGEFGSSTIALQSGMFQPDAAQGYASGLKEDLFDPNHIAEKEKFTFGAVGKVKTSVPDSISALSNQSAKSDLTATPLVVKNAALEQACESWRHRGNQAYTEGDFSKAEEYYTRGISCVPKSETPESCIRALALCYSNRAATRMAVSRLREALSDCMEAMNLDSNFLKARIRAASCHLALGECEAALAFFKDCLRSQNELESVDSKLASEALEGISKAQQVDEKTNEAINLLSTKKSEDVSNPLCLLNEALSISPHSEKLLELKAQALLSLHKYDEVIQTCEEGLASVNQNHSCGKSGNENQISNTGVYAGQCNCPVKLLLWKTIGKAQFYLGRLDEALASLSKYEEVNTSAVKSSGQRMETLAPLIATIRDLLHHKAAGNEAFQAGKFPEAEKHYTAALACNTESRPFTAVCFANRAAASHAQGHIADAIADCSRAMALDPKYLKAISRRSILHEMVRNYGQAITDLQRLITLQEGEEQNVKGGVLRRTGSSCNSAQDLKDARERLAKAQEHMRKGIPIDHYLILGVEPSCTAAEIKKAYRKAALKHHPDKAVQFLVRSDGRDEESLKECAEEVRRDAEKLFQLIGEAYAILSDPSKRLHYDAEEELQKVQPRRSTSMAEPESQSNSYHFEKNSRQHREGWDAWKDYKNQYNYSKIRPETSRTDNCSHRGPMKSADGVMWNDYIWDHI